TTRALVSSWLWDFGDGERSKEQNPVHIYTKPGLYSVGLTVAGPGGTAGETLKPDYILVEEPAVEAGFSADPVEGAPPLMVSFKDLSAGTISRWSWDFGDGQSSSEQHPRHTYDEPGLYAVTLSVTGDSRVDRIEKPFLIRVLEDAPEASFTAEPVEGTAPVAVRFTDTSEGQITDWLWNFGDGAYSSEQHPSHIYTVPGEYSVGLRVRSEAAVAVALEEAFITVVPQEFFRHGLAGTVTTSQNAAALIYLTGDEKRITETDADGAYRFEGLPPGEYRVTPFLEGVMFEPPSRQVRIVARDESGIDFSARSATGPSIVSAAVEPDRVPDDGQTPVTFIVGVAQAGAGVQVSLDLTPIGGTRGQPMYDDGTNGDETSGDGIYSFVAMVAAGVPPGPKGIPVKVADSSGQADFAKIELGVLRSIAETLGQNETRRETIENSIEG
ncbi:MAG: PKD domain-containing protein, partial [bacterium]|nr:PKD domain-containing protein [bacterium]